MTKEEERLHSSGSQWKKWGPYVADRQWGTVREDYSPNGDAWMFITHEMARSKTYRWGEDGIGGICDENQYLCLSLALWNGRDRIIKERLFGLNGREGNHGEDVKEYYYYLDNTPTHSYMKMLYKYPHGEFPYERLTEENRRRSRKDPEFELIDTGILNNREYCDVFVEYAKEGPEDILMVITAHNRGPAEVTLHIIPQVVFRNIWSWDHNTGHKPLMSATRDGTIKIQHPELGEHVLYADGNPVFLFCDNETNVRRLHGIDRPGYFKDGINDFVVDGATESVNPGQTGTKAGVHYERTIGPGDSIELRLRLTNTPTGIPFTDFGGIVARRRKEADLFYASLQSQIKSDDARRVQRQAFAGMLWSKQFYYYDVPQWLNGDPGQPLPPESRKQGRNSDWIHLNNANIISMPDKWEYPWYAAWDLAFHCVPLTMVDPGFAKDQLVLLTREWYMHPNGQFPAYEWSFGDVNPPVHAWATWRVYKMDQKMNQGTGDLDFLERVFHKLLLNFTWWVNRKDVEGHNIFQGGFLGLDNIGVFDRSAPLPTGGHISQADGTSWMAMYSLNLLRISLELAATKPIYQDMATKFFEHFMYIAGAMASIGESDIDLWSQEDQFFYDVLHCPDGTNMLLKVRSMVGLIPLFAVETIEPDLLAKLPEFRRRMDWFLNYRKDLAALVSRWEEPGLGERRLLSLLRGHRMKKLLKRMLDENEFLSDFGIRALSRSHKDHPYELKVDGSTFRVEYAPAESDSDLFGGNSNWRGPIWFPVNFLLIESLQKFHHYYGDDFKIECPTGSGTYMTIDEVANDLSRRLSSIFLRDHQGRRPVFGEETMFQDDPHFRDFILFHEYFHGDTGAGVGASHQTGWTGLVAKLLQPRSPEHLPPQEPGRL